MRSSKVVHVVSCHAEGEVGDVIVGGSDLSRLNEDALATGVAVHVGVAMHCLGGSLSGS